MSSSNNNNKSTPHPPLPAPPRSNNNGYSNPQLGLPAAATAPLSHLALRPSTLALLTTAGFVTAFEVHEATRRGWSILAAELGCSLTTAHAVGREVRTACGWDHDQGGESSRTTSSTTNSSSGANRMSAVQILQQQQQPNSTLPPIRSHSTTTCRSIITFCRDLDTVLQGGIALQEVTELAGGPGTGKTALCTQLAVNAALPVRLGGVHGQCVYIDTEGSFSAERCSTLATALLQHVQAGWRRRQKQQQQPANDISLDEGWTATTQEILEGIHVFRVHDAAHLEAVLHGALPALLLRQNAPDRQQQKQQPIKLVVVDSLAFPYRAYDVRQADFVARTRQLTQHCHHLTQLAQQHQLAVVVVNQMTTKQGRDGMVPALGESWAHAVTTRLLLSSSSSSSHVAQQQQQQRTCRLTKSPRLPSAAADFQIVEAGVRGMEYKSNSKNNPITASQNNDPNKRVRCTHAPAHHPQHPHP